MNTQRFHPLFAFIWARLRPWLPSRGSLLFTLLVAVVLVYAQRASALPGSEASQTPSATSTTTLPYQGRLTNNNGDPVSATIAMTFRFYNVPSGGTALWTEVWPGVQVSEGLFNVLLGSTIPISHTLITGNDSLWLGLTVGADAEMAPRIQIGSVPFAMQAITVSDESITTSKLANGAVTSEKLNVANAYSYVDTQESTNQDIWVSLPTPDIITITLATPQLVTIYYGATAASTPGNPAFISLSIDGAPPLNEPFIEMWNDSTTTISSVYQTELLTGTHTIELKYKTAQGATTYYWRRKILAFVISQ